MNIPFPTLDLAGVNHAGLRKSTLALILHSTRGGASTLLDEYIGSRNYCARKNDRDSGPNLMVGPASVTRFCSDDTEAWHATINNSVAYGIEIVQPTRTTPFTEWQVKTTATLCAELCYKYDVPIFHMTQNHNGQLTERGIYGHEDTAAGTADGKSDPGPMWHWPTFIPTVQAEYIRLYQITPPRAPTWHDTSPELRAYAIEHFPTTGFNLRALEYYRMDRDGDEVAKLANGSWLCRRAYTGQIEWLPWTE